jgi:hypothetical protein
MKTMPFQFADELLGRLRARHAAVHHDDVAELTVVGTAARELDRHRHVLGHVHEVEAWHRALRERGAFAPGLVRGSRGSALEIADKGFHDVFRLAEHEVRDLRKAAVARREQRSAAYHGLVPGCAALSDLAHRLGVDDHRADHHVVGPVEIAIA